MSAPTKLNLTCPECGSDLVIDVTSGRVIHHKKPKAPAAGGKDFDSLLADLGSTKSRADEVFQRELSTLKDQGRLLDEKFRERLRRVEEDPDEEMPARPWDLD
ncbi:MAG: hypothetical protein HC897_07025 [Thermoanaerobaculia bacterium]|nr:hypothetical protein [Thermoanaerobaculia bacterium]